MAPAKTFQSARLAKEPLVAEFPPDDRYPEGRRWEFSGDIDADAYLALIEQFGSDQMERETLPFHLVLPFFRAAFGADRLEELRKEASISELSEVAGWLWQQYGNLSVNEEEQADSGSG